MSTASYLLSRVALTLNVRPSEQLGSTGMSLTVSAGSSPSAALGVGYFATELVEVDDECLSLHDRLCVFDAFDIVVVCMLVRGLDGDDAVGAQHLELEVGIVWDRHELGIARAPQNSVISPLEPNHLEGKGLLAVVGGSAEADG